MKYSSIVASAVCAIALAPMAVAQNSSGYTPPKTSWGVPDIQGIFSSASLTNLTRPQGTSGLIISEEERQKLFNKNIYTRVAKEEAGDQQAVTSGKEKLALLTDANPDRAYNRYWMDPGADLGKINGQYRSSWIIDPPDGQIPFLKAPTGVGARLLESASAEEEFNDFGSDNPEDRSAGERCIGGSLIGPPLNNTMYNNNFQIVQTPDHVMIMAEMMHDVRVISLNGQHTPGVIKKWGGDSVGRYEGNALVVETTNLATQQRSQISAKGKVTERFSRQQDGTILYEFTVEDPTLYKQAWKGEMPLNPVKGLYEYACLEGNYSMFNLLNGARVMEREGRKNGARKAIFAGIADSDE